jgi:1,4-dihydroxy-2-naphthoate octaprenyltransferase
MAGFKHPMAYFRLVRPHWTIASTLAVMVGILQAWSEGYSHVGLASLVVGAAFIQHAVMEVWDELKDYSNYRQNVYSEVAQPPTLFSGGSGVLTGRLLTVPQVWRFFYTLLAVYVVVLGGIIHFVGWRFLLCVAAGMFFMFGYNSKLKLSYIGLGEFSNFISFGPILVCSAYLALRLGASPTTADANSWNLLGFVSETVLVESLILGTIWFGSLHIQEMLDYDEDKAGNKRTLVVRFGKTYASRVPFVTSLIIAALAAWLIIDDLAFAFVLPGVLLNLVETAMFMSRWRDAEYFMRKMKSFFVYRNFVLTALGLVVSYGFRDMPQAAGATALLALFALTAITSLPALSFLAKNRVFTFARAA